jgi:hypothetical protein
MDSAGLRPRRPALRRAVAARCVPSPRRPGIQAE